jgi:pseudouridine synthase
MLPRAQAPPGRVFLLPHQLVERNVQSVGRLDVDTTGLLLFSDDGAFIHNLSSPKKHVPKIYRAELAEDGCDKLVRASWRRRPDRRAPAGAPSPPACWPRAPWK